MGGPGAIVKALLAFLDVWLLMPHAGPVPLPPHGDVPALRCEHQGVATCDGLVFQAMEDSIGSMTSTRNQVLDALYRVRDDVKAHRSRSTPDHDGLSR